MVVKEYETKFSNPFAEIKKETPEYKAKRIRQRWIDQLNPKLNRKPLNDEEKVYVVQWIKDNLGQDDKIEWKRLISDMEKKFNTLRPDNIPKNYWYSLKRKLLGKIPQDEKLENLQLLSFLADKELKQIIDN
ncbi:hypothetical protein RclHR1_05300007 [Rhizophagus clarus]|nr:hypothetical protein RclHR1_05300007 [Rhizophagus clarus]